MENRIRLIGLVATVVFAAALTSCAGSSSDNISGSGGSNASGGNGAGGSSASGGSTGTGGNNASGGTGGNSSSGGTTGRGGTGGTATGGSGGSGTGGAKGGSGGTGTGGATGGAAGSGTGGAAGAGTGGAKGGTGGTATGGANGGSSGGAAGASGTGGATTPGTCSDNMQNQNETGVDCGGSCPACPTYKINGPATGDTVGSGCNGGPAFMCTRDMVFSPEFKVAETDDFMSPTNPQFVYGVVGHDKDTGGLDTESGGNACCQCYQLIFTSPRDNVSGVATPKPMIVQAFNTGAGGGKNFDIFMGSGGEGANTAGCNAQYTTYPSIGQPNNGGIRALTVSQCANNNMYTSSSIATMSCQDAIASDCQMIKAGNASVQSSTQVSCEETNQVQNLYHLNWNVMAKRIECPANLTRVTGCKLNSQGLPAADPTAVDMNSANGKGFSSGYTTTTMQDCCRPTCAYKGNVTGADGTYKQYYTCDSSGNPG
jgi:Glycosyl hydrolase family 45